ncbi:unnamed protein product [Rotaria socialis]
MEHYTLTIQENVLIYNSLSLFRLHFTCFGILFFQVLDSTIDTKTNSFMGIIGIEEFSSMSNYIPLYPINIELADECYLIVHDLHGSKNSHISVLIDLAGASTTTSLSGLLIHVTANDKDQNIPHTTNIRCDFRNGNKSELSIMGIGCLADSKYLHGNTALPNSIQNEFITLDMYVRLAHGQTPTATKQGILQYLPGFVALAVLDLKMVVLNSECNSTSNDPKFLWDHRSKFFALGVGRIEARSDDLGETRNVLADDPIEV